MTTAKDFEQLPKEEQNFRWALFLKSNGYAHDLSPARIEELRQRYLVNRQPLPKSYFEGR